MRRAALVVLLASASAAAQDPPPQKPRGEPVVVTPNDPLAMSPEMRAKIGSDVVEMPPPAEGEIHRQFFPYYSEQRGDYRLRTVPPLWLEHIRSLGTPEEDRQSLYGLLYYQRRSKRFDSDLLFPLFFNQRDDDARTTVIGPVVHRESPKTHDNWFLPLVFEGKRENGGYFQAPLGLFSSQWSTESAFTLWGPYFRSRTGTDTIAGVVPVYFHNESGDPGGRKSWTLVPPFLTYHRESELDQSALTIAGPLIIDTDPKRTAIDVAPLFFHIRGKPETGGIREQHTTFFPLFHYGYQGDERSLLWLPGYLRRIAPSSDTLVSPFYSHALTRNGDEGLRMGGPILPLVFDYRDKRLESHAWAIAPFYFQSASKRGFDYLTPLFGRFSTYGQSQTTWVFPTLTYSTDTQGFETDFHPLVYFGRSGTSSHAVLAPLYWDFRGLDYRSTVGFPFVWRFAQNESVTQLVVNTLYMQKRVEGGLETQTHVAPFVSWGSSPKGFFWNILFGLAGYSRDGDTTTVRALWIPIQTSGPPAQKSARR